MLGLAQEDAGPGWSYAGKLGGQRHDAGAVTASLIAEPPQVAAPPLGQQRRAVAEHGRGALVIAPVVTAAQRVNPVLPADDKFRSCGHAG